MHIVETTTEFALTKFECIDDSEDAGGIRKMLSEFG